MDKQEIFNYLDEDIINKLSYEIKKNIKKDCVLLLIGTDKCIGDAFAPLVGSLLTSYNYIKNPVYGTIKEPIHALNIKETLDEIKNKYPDKPIFVIDSMISGKGNIGDIILLNEGIFPGSAIGKKLPLSGDISLTLVVSNNEKDAINSLTTLRLNNIYEMAKVVANSIFIALSDSPYCVSSAVLQ
ncbi:spore protease YyaC [Anaerofustis stercorihominis]|uniref:spore protease YyaC n=1 Tax=Anaerofustis stercorihominis TaxID=214853 RepID=UPI0015F2F588|nr:spore protease YyaC [Anaerofustis stercorihominis]MCQ4795546.1 spore protease YyaC [Anaerofustis stercorihominis]